MDREAWRAAVHGVTKSWTRLTEQHHLASGVLCPMHWEVRAGRGRRDREGEVELLGSGLQATAPNPAPDGCQRWAP